MDYSWINTTWTAALMVVLSAVVIYVSLVLFTRLAGLRSFSKMSSFDFTITIALGTVVASTIITKDPPLSQAIVGLGMLYLIQMSVAVLRSKLPIVADMVDNKPLLLMDGVNMIDENLRKARVTKSDLLSKLREANVTQMNQIKAVVMETTGDISVLHHHDEEHEVDSVLLKGIE